MSGLALCRPIKPHAINSHFLLLPDRLLFIPTSCSGCDWVMEQESNWQVSLSRSSIWRTPLQTSTISIYRLVLGALLPGEGSCAWEMKMLGRAIDSIPWLLARARAKAAPSLLSMEWKKQLPKLCAPRIGRQECVWATSPSPTSLHGVYIPSWSLLTACPGTYGSYRHY